MAVPAVRVLEGHYRAYRRTWRGSLMSTFLNPVLYLAAIGLGLGTLVDAGTGDATLGGVAYLAYLAPGLLAATGMQTATLECTYPVMAGFKWIKSYDAMLSTPIGIGDLVLGHLGWVLVRLLLTTVVFTVVMAAFGAAPLAPALIAVLPAVLTGCAFAAAVTAYTAALHSEYGLVALFRFGVVPMFLFSGTFFPVTQLPEWMQPVAYVTPLWNGVELTRGVTLGTEATWPVWGHVAYLGVWVVLGTALAMRFFRRRLER